MGIKLTQEEFIEKAKLKHGDKYDYSMVKYIGSQKKVIIICKEHGEFSQTSMHHISGSGCKKCFIKSKSNFNIDINEFIMTANIKHNNKYDYSKSVYINSTTNIIIICKKHGEFNQTTYTHLKGIGCSKCSGNSKLNNYSFIQKAISKHGNRYDYSKINYIKSLVKIKIICKKHGEFMQTPSSHLSGKGCPVCSSSFKMCTESFIKKSMLKHENRYDYSKTKYIGNKEKVIVICREHGEFMQTPFSHLQGQGCKICSNLNKSCISEFIERSLIIHENKYDYSNISFVNIKTKIGIICKEHGLFEQIPKSHLVGKGCPRCGNKFGIMENKWLDNFNILDEYRQYKISKYIVDGYDPVKNTIYEFYGDFWHGNPNRYNSSELNKVIKLTFGELYERTLQKENKLKELGYNIISIWESDFLKE